jgi:hypothetical protein
MVPFRSFLLQKGDLRVLSLLITLYDAYPHRVTLIMGNRDVNKMRLKHELSKAGLDTPAHCQSFSWQKLASLPIFQINNPTKNKNKS